MSELWFRLPAGPRPAKLPPAGEPFEVPWEHGVVRGTTWGAGPVVYLVHGWGGRGDQFAALIGPLVAAGYRAVIFDAPSHGASDPGEFGTKSTTGIEFAKALDAVFARFGPAQAVVAHSMGTLTTLLALRHGWLGTARLVFVAPMTGYTAAMDGFQAMVGFGRGVRRRVDDRVWARVGLMPEEFEMVSLWHQFLGEQPPLLIVHDKTDPQTSYAASKAVARELGAEFLATTGLGHNRILKDPDVVDTVIRFLGPVDERVRWAASA